MLYSLTDIIAIVLFVQYDSSGLKVFQSLLKVFETLTEGFIRYLLHFVSIYYLIQ